MNERRDLLLGLVGAAIDQHDRWVKKPELTYITAGVDESMTDLMDGFSEGTIPGDCRQLAELVDAFGRRWREWQDEVDRQGGRATVPPSEECWKSWEAVVDCYQGVVEPPRPRLESIATLRSQKVPDRQICEIYGWIDGRGQAESWKIEEELAEPGKHTKDHVDPITRRRLEAAEKERALTERVKALRKTKLARMTAECPESLSDLIRQGVSLQQIAAMLRITEDQVLARCDDEGLPRPPHGPSLNAIPGSHDPELPEPMARQFEAQEAERERQQAEATPEDETVEAEAGQATLDQQIVEQFLQGLDATEIASELTSPAQKVSRQKVQAVIKRYQEDPEAIGAPGGE